MKKKYSINEVCKMFGLTAEEVQDYMYREELLFSTERGNTVSFSERHINIFKKRFPDLAKSRKKKFMPDIENNTSGYVFPTIRKGDVTGQLVNDKEEVESLCGFLNTPEFKSKMEEIVNPNDKAKQELIKLGIRMAPNLGSKFDADEDTGAYEVKKDPCMWNPEMNRKNKQIVANGVPVTGVYEHNESATVTLGASEEWMLCESCANLPKFKRFRVRRKI